MARLIPSIQPEEIGNRGEQFMARYLVDQLPDEVEVFHSFSWQRRDERDRPQEGECDFILVDPQRGMVGIEVKGGQIEYDPEAGLWWRQKKGGSREALNRNPFDQVNRSMHTIRQLLEKALCTPYLPFTYTYAAAFPEGRFIGTPPPGTTPERRG